MTVPNLNRDILQIFCSDLDEFLISHNAEIQELDLHGDKWLSITSDELLNNISFVEFLKLNRILRKEKHVQRLKKGFAALIRISDFSGTIVHITPLAPINIAEILDEAQTEKKLLDLVTLFDTWVTKVKFDNFRNVITRYWIEKFKLSDFELSINYSARKNEIIFTITTHLRNPSNKKKYFKKIKYLLPKENLRPKIDKNKQVVKFSVATSEEIYTY